MGSMTGGSRTYGTSRPVGGRPSSIRLGTKTAINNYLNEVLTHINQRDTEKINQRKEEILRILKAEFEEVVDLTTGGSYSRYTYVNGLSDVDILIDLGNYSASGITGKENSEIILQYVADRLEQRYPRTEMKVGKMAVTLKFSDGIEIQVIPAFRHYSGHKIPDPDSSGWISTYPKKFAEDITELNKKTGGKVKPVIKLTKYMLANNNIEVRSYHLENLAIEAYKNYTGSQTPYEMLIHLMNQSKTRVLRGMDDPSGQFERIDAHLGPRGSLKRQQLSRELRNLEARLKNAKSAEECKKIVEGNT